MAKEDKPSLITPDGIAAFVYVFEPREGRKSKNGSTGKSKYQMMLVWDKKTDLSELEQQIEDFAIEKFGPKAPQLIERGKINTPIRDALEYEEYGPPFVRGSRMASFKTTNAPGIVDESANAIMDRDEIYPGMLARVSYGLYSYDEDGNRGIGLFLNNLQKRGKGMGPLTGKRSAEDEFGSLGDNKARKPARRSHDDDDDDEPPRRSAARKPARRSRDDDDDDLMG